MHSEDRLDALSSPDAHRAEAPWAVMRLVLGFAQMSAAVAALFLIITWGFEAVALAAVAISCLLTTVSVLLFGSRGPRGHAADRSSSVDGEDPAVP